MLHGFLPNSLLNVEAVEGALQIVDGCEATDAVMDNFADIKAVSGLVQLSKNDQVSDMQGLKSLVRIGDNLVIEYNDGLATLDGLNGSRLTVSGNLIIRFNSNLSSIASLNKIQVQGK
jgi:hypothetical protein